MNALNNQIERAKDILRTRKELPCTEPSNNQEAEEEKSTSKNKSEKSEFNPEKKPIIARLQNLLTSITSKLIWTSSHEESVV